MTAPILALLGAILSSASAQAPVDPVDLGVITNDELLVVQRLLYPKSDRVEVGAALGWAAWDRYLTTPLAQLSIDVHRSEAVSFSAVLGAGYGLKNATYRELEVDYGIAPYTYRYLGSALFGVAWSPIYAKASLGARRVVHHDVYGVLRVGASLGTSTIPNGGLAIAPTASLGIGARVFTFNNLAVRLEARDDVLLERHKLTDNSVLKQRFLISIGLSFLSDAT